MIGVKVQGVEMGVLGTVENLLSLWSEKGGLVGLLLYFVPVSVIQNSSDATNAFRPQTQLNHRFDEVMVETLGAP